MISDQDVKNITDKLISQYKVLKEINPNHPIVKTPRLKTFFTKTHADWLELSMDKLTDDVINEKIANEALEWLLRIMNILKS